MDSVFSYMFAFMATIVFVNILHQPAKRLGLVDIPSGRKNHTGEVPLTGGLAMFFAILLTAFLHDSLRSACISFFPALLLLVATGACDDKFELSPGSRFLTQAVAALLMIYVGKVAITDLGDLLGFGAIHLGLLSVPFTVFCVIGVINAINMLDGIDGLAGGVVFVYLLVFGGAALLSGNAAQAALLFLVASAVLGFIAFNMRSPWRSKAAVFMGDSGSMMLGFVLAWFAIDLAEQETAAFTPITAVWILAIPILDTVSLMLRRMLKGKSPFSPDHDHLHHIFLRSGFSVPQTTLLIMGLSLAFGMIGMGAWYFGVPEHVMFYSFVLLFLAYFTGMLYAWKLMRLVRRVHDFRVV